MLVKVTSVIKNNRFPYLCCITLLPTRVESAYSLICRAHRIWGQAGGEPLALL